MNRLTSAKIVPPFLYIGALKGSRSSLKLTNILFSQLDLEEVIKSLKSPLILFSMIIMTITTIICMKCFKKNTTTGDGPHRFCTCCGSDKVQITFLNRSTDLNQFK